MGKIKRPSFFLVLTVLICIVIAGGLVSAAIQIPTNKNVNLTVANDNGVKFPVYSANAYNFFSPTQSGGMNELHISSSSSTPYGDVTNTTSTTGTFYLTNTGGRGWHDDGILMIAVNGTQLDDIEVQINSAGYQWTPVQSGTYPNYSTTTYSQGISENFTISDFTGANGYYSKWKPCPTTNYPIFEDQDMSIDNTFKIIFVDLYAGTIGQNTLSSPTWVGQTPVNNGALQVNYTISNLPEGSMVAFNSYGFCNSSSQGQGVRWTNSVTVSGSSGYIVRNY